jgi:hypothetical protein
VWYNRPYLVDVGKSFGNKNPFRLVFWWLGLVKYITYGFFYSFCIELHPSTSFKWLWLNRPYVNVGMSFGNKKPFGLVKYNIWIF